MGKLQNIHSSSQDIDNKAVKCQIDLTLEPKYEL